MNGQPTTNSTRGSLTYLWPWLVVLMVLLCVGFIRIRLSNMPLERDEGEYAYAGQLILQGIPPYKLVYNMKLPGTYYAYALGMQVFGQTATGVHLTLMVANSLAIIFVFLLARKLFGVTAGLVACASYAVMSVSPAVLGLAAHANHFVVLFAIPATLLLWQARETNRIPLFFFSGLLYGLALLMVQQGMYFCLFGIFFLGWSEMQTGQFSWRRFVKTGATGGAGMILPYVLLCLYLLQAGVFREFWFWTVTYARSYVGLVSWSKGLQELFFHCERAFPVSVGFWILAIVGLLFSWRDKNLRHRVFFVGFLWLFSFLAAATGLYFRDHYFILVLPAFSILVGLAVRVLQDRLRFRMTINGAKIIPLVLFVGICSWNLFFQRDVFFSLSGNQVSRKVYRGFPFVESVAVSQYLREHSSPDAQIAVVGSEPEIYFDSHRHSATGYIYTYALMEAQPYAARMQRQMIQEIESNQPEYLVWVGFENSWLNGSSSDLTIFHWVEGYTAKFYERIGIADTHTDGTTRYFWGAAARNYRGPVGQYIVVYKRRDLKAAPQSRWVN